MIRHYRIIVYFAIGCILLLAGCNSVDKREEEKGAKLHADRKAQWYKDSVGVSVNGRQLPTTEVVHIEKQFPDVRRSPVNPYPIYTPDQKKSVDPVVVPQVKPSFDNKTKIKIDLSFNAAAIEDVIPVFADLLKINYQIDGNLKGIVTLFLSEQMTKQEIWELLKRILHNVGAYVAIENQLMTFKPLDIMVQDTRYEAADGSMELAVFRLKNIGSKEAVAQITTFLSKGNKPLVLGSRNVVIVLDRKDVIAKLRYIISEFDQPLRHGWAKMVIPCRSIDAKRLAFELGEILPVLGFPVAKGEKAQPEEIQLIAVDRLQVLIASAASKEALKELGRWAGILDQTGLGDQEKIYIYNIVNGNAEELVKALSVMFPVEGITLTPSASSGEGAKKGEAQDSAVSSKTVKKNTAKEGQASVFETPVKIFADAVNERLLIRTKPRAFSMIKALLEKIDTIPQQVLLQMMIVDVTLNDSVKFGIEFMMQSGNDNVGISGGTNYTGLIPSQDAQNAQSGGRFYIYNPKNPEQKFAYVNALAGKTNVKVISNPQLLIASRSEAKISVGQKVPIVNSEITNTQSTTINDTNLMRSIQYQDTGVILKITPRITRGGRINVVLDQTVSEADQNTTSDIDSPVIKEQVINTTMSIRDGQTIVCGGMIREKISDNFSTLPIIGNIQFLRRLVGDSDISTERTEMMILITGTIISEKTQLEMLLKKYEESVNSIIRFNLPAKEKKRATSQGKGLLESWFIE